uniref:Uncharacterized protein n=1 Tax=Anguilla anguilla TaxID=7936 RepID=A0A0E9PX18_ANGAN
MSNPETQISSVISEGISNEFALPIWHPRDRSGVAGQSRRAYQTHGALSPCILIFS